MSEKGNLTNQTQPTSPLLTESTKTTEGPLLLEIKAAVEKLAGDVRGLTERMNKQDEKKPKDEKYPVPCKACELVSEEEKAKKPIIPYPKKKEDASEEEEKAKKPEDYPKPPKKQDEASADHGCSPDEEWDETEGKCVPKAAKAAKPVVPYPKEKKSLEIITEGMEAMKNEIITLQKALNIPLMKRTEVVRKEDLTKSLDVGSMSWSQLHELARPYDLGRAK